MEISKAVFKSYETMLGLAVLLFSCGQVGFTVSFLNFLEVKSLFLIAFFLHLCQSFLFAETKLLIPEVILMNQSP